MRLWCHHLIESASALSHSLYRLTNGDFVVIVDGNQVTKLQVSSQTGRFTSNTFLSATITKEDIRVVVNEVETRLVELGGGMSLRNSETDRVGETLTQRASCNFNARSVMSLWMTWCNAVNLLKDVSYEPCAIVLSLLGSASSRSARLRIRTSEGSHIVAYIRGRCYNVSASEVQRSVCNDDSREDESVAVQPVRVLWVELHELVE